MGFRELSIHRLRTEEIPSLEEWRREYKEADLEVPHGYGGQGVETAVVEAGGEMLAALTGTSCVVIDPLIRNPRITNGAEMISAIILLERTLSYLGEKGGAVDSYVAISNGQKDWQKIVESTGYVRSCQDCTIYRRPLRPDVEPTR
jgi:hypothetical protein